MQIIVFLSAIAVRPSFLVETKEREKHEIQGENGKSIQFATPTFVARLKIQV